MVTVKLTQKILKEGLTYDKYSGLFRWRIKLSRGINVGEIAGGEDHRGYYFIRIDNVIYREHRLAWLYIYGNYLIEIDHINHNRADNKIVNLREVTHSENQRNQKLFSTNTSRHVGVVWCKQTRKWRSTIKLQGKLKCLGRFSGIEYAIKARKQADIKYGFHKNHGV